MKMKPWSGLAQDAKSHKQEIDVTTIHLLTNNGSYYKISEEPDGSLKVTATHGGWSSTRS